MEIRELLELGADKTLKNRTGQLPVQRVRGVGDANEDVVRSVVAFFCGR